MKNRFQKCMNAFDQWLDSFWASDRPVTLIASVLALTMLLATITAFEYRWAVSSPTQVQLDPDIEPGIVYIFEKDKCKDCEAVIPGLKVLNDKNVEFINVKHLSKDFLEKYNITDVPCGITLKSSKTFVNLSLYTNKREIDWENYDRLKELAERYKNGPLLQRLLREKRHTMVRDHARGFAPSGAILRQSLAPDLKQSLEQVFAQE